MLKIAVVQMDSQSDKKENLEVANSLIREAAKDGAEFVALPEYFNFIGLPEDEFAQAETMDNGETIKMLSDLAKELQLWIHGGSILERVEGDEKLYNTTFIFNPKGDLTHKYRKIHLFDVEISNGPSFLESKTIRAGSEIVTVDILDIKVGMSICYDVRFPELYRLQALDGAEMFIVPADFTLYTGKDHWEVLLRARAIENQTYVIAPGQIGKKPGFQSYGRSLIVDPWGTVIAKSSDKVGYISTYIDLDYLRSLRTEVPSLRNRRPEVYDLRVLKENV